MASDRSCPRVLRQQQFEDLLKNPIGLLMIKTYWFQDLINSLVLRRQQQYSHRVALSQRS